MGSIFDAIGAVLGGGGQGGAPPPQGGQADLLKAVIAMMGQGGSGGLSELVRNFQGAGLGDQVSSWLGTGQNMPVSPAELERGLGRQRVQDLSSSSGLSMETLMPMLAAVLPAVIDKLSPQGQLPADDRSLDQQMSQFKKLLG